jgi:hypothetical protein
MTESESDLMLQEVFGRADLREALLGDTLRRVRRRRHFRQARGPVAVAAALALAAGLVWRQAPPRQPTMAVPMAPRVAAGCEVVRTQEFPPGLVVRTKPFLPSRLMAQVVAGVQIVQTMPGHYRLIDDDQLLALAAPMGPALVRIGPHSEELVFANPREETATASRGPE